MQRARPLDTLTLLAAILAGVSYAGAGSLPLPLPAAVAWKGARAGPLAHAAWIGLAIWSLYFAGQVLICTGVSGVDRGGAMAALSTRSLRSL